MAVFPLLQATAELWRDKRGAFERLTRPVSLTSILVKSLERIIHKHIMKFLKGLFQLESMRSEAM